MAITYSITTTLVASAATAAADTIPGHAGALPGTGWTFASGTGIASTSPAADWIVIEFSLGATVGLWVCGDGNLVGSLQTPGTGQAVITAGAPSAIFLPPGQSQPTTISNIQPMPNWNALNGVIVENSGPAKDGSQSNSINLTAQSGFTGTHSASHWPYGPNVLALIPTASATGSVTITFQ